MQPLSVAEPAIHAKTTSAELDQAIQSTGMSKSRAMLISSKNCLASGYYGRTNKT